MIEKIEIYDTTLRDGTQSLDFTLSAKEKLDLLIKFDEYHIDIVEGGFPQSNPKEDEFFKYASMIDLKNTRLAAFGMTSKNSQKVSEDEGIRSLIEANTPVITIVGKTWDFHVRDVLGVSNDENLKMISSTIKFLTGQGKSVIYDAEHFFDGYKENPSYATKTLQAALEAHADKVVLCDTNGGTLYYEVQKIIKELKSSMGNIPFGIHTHNDTGMAVPNALEAVRQGAEQVQGTINGVGERCGNADLITIIANLFFKMDFEVLNGESSINGLTKLSRYVNKIANREDDISQSYVGKGAFSHKGGMHAHAVLKNVSTYEHVPPETVGNSRNIIIGELSGTSAVNETLYKKLGIKTEDKVLSQIVLERICEMENKGYVYEDAEASLILLIKEIIGSTINYFKIEHYSFIINSKQATDKFKVDISAKIGKEKLEASSKGNGILSCYESTLRKLLEVYYPFIVDVKNINRKIKFDLHNREKVNTVRITADFTNISGYIWTTVSVGDNFVEAAIDSINEGYQFYIYEMLSKTNEV
jgi:2-isopropylmalate synthase